MSCQLCGVDADTKLVAFRYNIGAVVLRFHKTTEGYFCKTCIHKEFWKNSGINLVLGWWGMISLIATPIFQVMNIYNYASAMGLDPPTKEPPRLGPPSGGPYAS